MKRTPMKRTAWPSRAPAVISESKAGGPIVERSSSAIRKVAVMARVPASPAAAIPKNEPVRSEALRRAVASLPCVICGVPGFSQAAHGSEGKGMGLKACDLTLFPACCDRPGVRGCHSKLDQGAMLSKAARRAMEPAWAADTRRRIVALGLWPANLPKFEDRNAGA